MRSLLSIIAIFFVGLFFVFFFIYQKNNQNVKDIVVPAKEIHNSQVYKTDPSNKVTQTLPIQLSIKNIFKQHKKQNYDLKIIATGDVIPARSVNFISTNKNDFTWAWKNTYQKLASADLTVINLETPLLQNCQPTIEGMIFCGSSKHLQGLKLSGVDIANLANNHAGNYGIDGVKQTIDLLKEENISVSGTTNQPIIYKTIKNTRLAFLGYNNIGAKEPLINWIDMGKVKKDIVKAKNNADLVVVQFHWGTEYMSQPELETINLAHQAVDWGADLIIGNHPHWIQPVEIYHNKIITYAHGNFIFDQEWSKETKLGVIGEYKIYNKQFVDADFYPVKIISYGQPYFLEGDEKQQILHKMYQESKILKEKLSQNK